VSPNLKLVGGLNPIKFPFSRLPGRAMGGFVHGDSALATERSGHVEHVSLDTLRKYRDIDREKTPRIRNDHGYLDQLTDAMRSGVDLGPVTLDHDPQAPLNTKLFDGNHRLAAAERLGLKSLPTRMRRGGKPSEFGFRAKGGPIGEPEWDPEGWTPPSRKPGLFSRARDRFRGPASHGGWDEAPAAPHQSNVREQQESAYQALRQKRDAERTAHHKWSQEFDRKTADAEDLLRDYVRQHTTFEFREYNWDGGASAGPAARPEGPTDTRSQVDKLKAMADQAASPNEADVARRMLRKRGIKGYAKGGPIGNPDEMARRGALAQYARQGKRFANLYSQIEGIPSGNPPDEIEQRLGYPLHTDHPFGQKKMRRQMGAKWAALDPLVGLDTHRGDPESQAHAERMADLMGDAHEAHAEGAEAFGPFDGAARAMQLLNRARKGERTNPRSSWVDQVEQEKASLARAHKDPDYWLRRSLSRKPRPGFRMADNVYGLYHQDVVADTLRDERTPHWEMPGDTEYDPLGKGPEWTTYKKRAKGGATGRPGPYVVGERGPEIFVPESDGWIIPNHLMSQLPKRADGGSVGKPSPIPTPTTPTDAFCPDCGAGPFMNMGYYERHWHKEHGSKAAAAAAAAPKKRTAKKKTTTRAAAPASAYESPSADRYDPQACAARGGLRHRSTEPRSTTRSSSSSSVDTVAPTRARRTSSTSATRSRSDSAS
jgi:hypothetical protein